MGKVSLVLAILSVCIGQKLTFAATTIDLSTADYEEFTTSTPGEVNTGTGGTPGNGDPGQTDAPEPQTRICREGLNCYKLTDAEGTWQEAKDTCRGGLAIVEDADEYTFLNDNLGDLADLAANDEVWFGAQRTVNITHWYNAEPDEPISDDLPDFTAPIPDYEDGCGVIRYTGGATNWIINNCEAPPRYGLCEFDPNEEEGGDGGLSDGEIAAIAVCSSLAVAGAAAGGGYYAYSKRSSDVAPGEGDAEAGEGGENKEEDVTVEDGDNENADE